MAGRLVSLSLLLAVAVSVGCSAPEGRSARLKRVASAVAIAVQSGPVTVRYNPVACECPPYEVWVDGRWIRLQLAIPTPAEDPALLFVVEGDDHLVPASRSLTLSLESSKPRFCANGTAFYLASVVPEEPAPPQ